MATDPALEACLVSAIRRAAAEPDELALTAFADELDALAARYEPLRKVADDWLRLTLPPRETSRPATA